MRDIPCRFLFPADPMIDPITAQDKPKNVRQPVGGLAHCRGKKDKQAFRRCFRGRWAGSAGGKFKKKIQANQRTIRYPK
jgi:hypothetical protein